MMKVLTCGRNDEIKHGPLPRLNPWVSQGAQLLREGPHDHDQQISPRDSMTQIIAAHKYEGGAIEIARRIKNASDDEALEAAAADMVGFIPKGAVLVPAPSSSGMNRATVVLAMKISALAPDARLVEAVIRSTPVQSSHLLRKSGRRGLSVAEHVASMQRVQDVPEDKPIIVIDNVVTEGHTIEAIAQVLERDDLVGVVYADAKRGRGVAKLGDAPEGPLRVCISGSRDFRNLSKVDLIMELLPDDTVVLHGGARGVDERADAAARRRGLAVEVTRPDWKRHGKKAGPMRNREMVKGCDHLIAFWNGISRGTASAIQAALEFGVDLDVIFDD